MSQSVKTFSVVGVLTEHFLLLLASVVGVGTEHFLLLAGADQQPGSKIVTQRPLA
jgi:hypothetical protein